MLTCGADRVQVWFCTMRAEPCLGHCCCVTVGKSFHLPGLSFGVRLQNGASNDSTSWGGERATGATLYPGLGTGLACTRAATGGGISLWVPQTPQAAAGHPATPG